MKSIAVLLLLFPLCALAESTFDLQTAKVVIDSKGYAQLILTPEQGARVGTGQTVEVAGIAWDGGAGIVSVDVSLDGGRSWHIADLGEDLGRFSWRQWRYLIPSARPGGYAIMARATNRLGMSQTRALLANPAGYHHNVMHRVAIQVG